MANTTSRLGLTQPVGTDAASELRVSITDNATILDAAVTITEGTLASRPSASSVPYGTAYYTTDTSQWFQSNGTAWVEMAQAVYTYRHLLLQGTSGALAGNGPGDMIFVSGGGLVYSSSPSGVASAPMWIGDSGLSSQPQDFQVANRTAYARIRAMLNPNGTSAGITVTFGLYQITGSGGAGGQMSFTFGTALTGSTVALSSASSLVGGESSQFALPSSGFWALGVNFSGAVPSNAVIGLNAQLYGYNA